MKAVIGWMVLVASGVTGCAVDVIEGSEETGSAESYVRGERLRYRQLDITAPPPGLDQWNPIGISDRGEVVGNALDCDDEFVVCAFQLVKLKRNGDFVFLAEDGVANDVNASGDGGGCVVEDLATGFGQAAVFRANGGVRLLPRLPGEISSCVLELSDSGVAVVSSLDADFVETVYVVRGNRTAPFTLENAAVIDVNDRGELAGIASNPAGDRAFRFDSRAQRTTLLEPVAPDPHSWGLAINRRGEVLGYSFIFDGVERIGKWNRRGEFETYFVQGTPEFPTLSSQLIWNEDELIVISLTTDGSTYLVPEPGVRLDLQDLVVGGAIVPSSLLAGAINDRGDFVAISLSEGTSWLYRRTER